MSHPSTHSKSSIQIDQKVRLHQSTNHRTYSNNPSLTLLPCFRFPVLAPMLVPLLMHSGTQFPLLSTRRTGNEKKRGFDLQISWEQNDVCVLYLHPRVSFVCISTFREYVSGWSWLEDGENLDVCQGTGNEFNIAAIVRLQANCIDTLKSRRWFRGELFR